MEVKSIDFSKGEVLIEFEVNMRTDIEVTTDDVLVIPDGP